MAGILKNLKTVDFKKIPKWIGENPIKSTYIGLFLGSPIIDRYLKSEATKALTLPVYNKVVEGSKPDFSLNPATLIPRPDVLADVITLFFPKSDDVNCTRFGVIIGPSRSEKTTAIRNLCKNYPKGVLYHEISEPATFVMNLSKELGMKTAPSTVFDLMLGHISQRYTHYHVLPTSQLAGIDTVIGLLEKVCT